MPNPILAPDEDETDLPAQPAIDPRARRLAPDERALLAAKAMKLYSQGGADIRAVAGEIGVAYNTTRLLLQGAGAELRSHGGPRNRQAQGIPDSEIIAYVHEHPGLSSGGLASGLKQTAPATSRRLCHLERAGQLRWEQRSKSKAWFAITHNVTGSTVTS